jgi:glycosyltransferase involved in cell wall biosynthesis
VQLLCVAALVPRKGHAVLFAALESIESRDWLLTCVGSLDRHPAMAEELRALARTKGLDRFVEFAGEADSSTIPRYYDSADVFVLPTLFEGYGMAVAEALARGLPVVSTHTGAIADLVGDDAGIVVPPGDVSALTEALRHVLSDPSAGQIRRRLAQGARLVRERLPTWDDAASRMDALLVRVAG